MYIGTLLVKDTIRIFYRLCERKQVYFCIQWTWLKRWCKWPQLPGSSYPDQLLWHSLGGELNLKGLKKWLLSQQFSPQKLLPCWNRSWVACEIFLGILDYKLQQFRKQLTICVLRRTEQVNVVVVPLNLLLNLLPQSISLLTVPVSFFFFLLLPFFLSSSCYCFKILEINLPDQGCLKGTWSQNS